MVLPTAYAQPLSEWQSICIDKFFASINLWPRPASSTSSPDITPWYRRYSYCCLAISLQLHMWLLHGDQPWYTMSALFPSFKCCKRLSLQHQVIEATVSVIELYKVTMVMLMWVQMVSEQQPQYAKHTNSYPRKRDPSQLPQNHNQYISLSLPSIQPFWVQEKPYNPANANRDSIGMHSLSWGTSCPAPTAYGGSDPGTAREPSWDTTDNSVSK